MSLVIGLCGLAAALPWAYVISDLQFVREWQAVRRTRRTTRAIRARDPEPRPPYEPPFAAKTPLKRCVRVMAPTTGSPGAVVGVRGYFPCR